MAMFSLLVYVYRFVDLLLKQSSSAKIIKPELLKMTY